MTAEEALAYAEQYMQVNITQYITNAFRIFLSLNIQRIILYYFVSLTLLMFLMVALQRQRRTSMPPKPLRRQQRSGWPRSAPTAAPPQAISQPPLAPPSLPQVRGSYLGMNLWLHDVGFSRLKLIWSLILDRAYTSCMGTICTLTVCPPVCFK